MPVESKDLDWIGFELWEMLNCVWPFIKLYEVRSSLCVSGCSNRMREFAVLYGQGQLHIYRKCND